MTRKYTASDFANARFAEHPDGNVSSRAYPMSRYPWAGKESYADAEMAGAGWVPVSTELVLTESQVVRVYVAARDNMDEFYRELKLLGFEIVPDPEPTNTEKWQALVNMWQEECDNESPHVSFAEWIDRKGITAPTVKDN